MTTDQIKKAIEAAVVKAIDELMLQDPTADPATTANARMRNLMRTGHENPAGYLAKSNELAVQRDPTKRHGTKAGSALFAYVPDKIRAAK